MSNNIGKLTTPTGVGSSIQVNESGQVDIIGQIKFTSSPTNSPNNNIGFSGSSTTDELRISGSPVWQDGGYLILYPKNTINTETQEIADYAGGYVLGCCSENNKLRELRCYNNNLYIPNGLLYSDQINDVNSYWNGIVEEVSANNNIWCIKYSNGLIMHWGSGSTNNTNPCTINFLRPYTMHPMITTNITGIAADNNYSYTVRHSQTETYVLFKSYNYNSAVGGIGFNWIAIGY